jgi:hypothetical protein
MHHFVTLAGKEFSPEVEPLIVCPVGRNLSNSRLILIAIKYLYKSTSGSFTSTDSTTSCQFHSLVK